jgi:hypothetical protein
MFGRSWNLSWPSSSTRSAVGLRVVTPLKNALAPGATTVVGVIADFHTAVWDKKSHTSAGLLMLIV